MITLGIDTSNYTTSVALFDGEKVWQKKKLLPVKEGERGIRQSDAVFHHTKQYPDLLSELMAEGGSPELSAVGASVTPTTENGSYMPCFLVGEGAANAVKATVGIPLHTFSHQQGHIAAALFSAEKLPWMNESFLAFHVSGGTTDAVLCEPNGNIFSVKPLVSSNDLKAGQAVDRIGVKMGFSFPCGKEIEKCALLSEKTYRNKIKLYDGSCSLSGLENRCNKLLDSGEEKKDVSKFLLSYIADTVSAMAENLLKTYPVPLIFAGGVMSNSIIRDTVMSRFDCAFAEPEFSCDNAAGIAILTYLEENK